MAKSDISILDAAIVEYFAPAHFPSIDLQERYGRHAAIRALMVRLNLHDQFSARVKAHSPNEISPT
ncbi:hypothetical protein HYP99_gp092 [Sinorhizobium phage ort11]|uniref:Uncharacterized protein n=1 Tax=Sinorhizobium phage ort11 TaxID=2599764 RepID=A0A5C2H7E2_9CAUD|nr:hypothetical protein HYP99_gp092 [Sinorhizobium phage ort11]QEP29901.1 hypothetical protein Smphiort11_103 [Sinorhizobium phage ort11]